MLTAAVPEYLEEFLELNFGSWGIFDARYLGKLDSIPDDYFVFDQPEPIKRYSIARVSPDNVRCCIHAFQRVSEEVARQTKRKPVSDRTSKRMAVRVLRGLQSA